MVILSWLLTRHRKENPARYSYGHDGVAIDRRVRRLE